jgi:two-component system, response regulator YesN
MDQYSNINSMEQKDFWDSLHIDILTSNQKLVKEDYLMYVERSVMFSMFFRGCTPLEIKSFQKLFGIEEYAYVILFEISEINKTNLPGSPVDDISLYRLIKNSAHLANSTIGPLVTNRMSILISHDYLLKEQDQIDESISLSREFAKIIETEYETSVKVGIGSMQNIHSIYTSFLDALACMYNGSKDNITNYLNYQKSSIHTGIDYLETEKHLVEAIRLRKPEAYSYFGIILDGLRSLNDDAKRNKIFELLVLSSHTMQIDGHADFKYIDYTSYVNQFMALTGNELIEFAFQCFIYITSYVKSPTTIDYTNHIVKATREYLESHYTDDISLEDMASQVNISPQYFSKLIKKTTGFNFIDWLSMLRVKRAKELLANPNLTVKEVCFMVGYKDPNYFSRIFKKRLGITPSEYVKTSSYLSNKS